MDKTKLESWSESLRILFFVSDHICYDGLALKYPSEQSLLLILGQPDCFGISQRSNGVRISTNLGKIGKRGGKFG